MQIKSRPAPIEALNSIHVAPGEYLASVHAACRLELVRARLELYTLTPELLDYDAANDAWCTRGSLLPALHALSVKLENE